VRDRWPGHCAQYAFHLSNAFLHSQKARAWHQMIARDELRSGLLHVQPDTSRIATQFNRRLLAAGVFVDDEYGQALGSRIALEMVQKLPRLFASSRTSSTTATGDG
jgi:hypothetical protein